MDAALFGYLETFLTEPRRTRLREVLALRTRHITLVLDDIYQPHNISAVLRSCDAFGVQDVHLVEERCEMELSADIAAGSDKWLTLHRHQGKDAAARCAESLRQADYRIVATLPDAGAVTPETLPVDTPLALVIGGETAGVSSALLEAADERLTIPMFGFVDSFNLSVACALCLQDLSRRLRAGKVEWNLAPAESEQLLFEWTRASIANVTAIEARWRRDQAALSVHPSTSGKKL